MILISNLATLPITPDTVVVGGFYAPGDGGGGNFIYDASSSLTPDGGIVFASNSGGNWLRIFSGPVNVRWFGAIISMASGLTDVTAQVHAARDSIFTKKGGTLYFPMCKDNQGQIIPYIGAFEFFNLQGEINIVGDGEGSVLKSNNTDDPVLRLGLRIDSLESNWRFSKVSMLSIDGSAENPPPPKPYIPIRRTDGIVFQDQATPYTQISGRWVIENVTIKNCKRGIYKPTGNIGNTYSNCLIEYNDFGYYTIDVSNMHGGSDRFLGGHLNDNDKAAICVNVSAVDGYGQLIIDGTILEYNAGFGIFVKLGQTINRMTTAAVELRNIWTEGNASATTVTIDSVAYSPMDYYFEEVRSVTVFGSMLRSKLKAVASSIMLVNCRSGIIAEVDRESSIVADGLRYLGGPSETIFVNSISYDGTLDIYQSDSIPSSVWGPLRVVRQTGNNNIKVSEHFSEGAEFEYSGGTINSGIADGGIILSHCSNIPIPANDLIYNTLTSFYIYNTELLYYVWSIHAYWCQDEEDTTEVFGRIGCLPWFPGSTQLGQVILKKNKWVCSYGVKQLIGGGINPPQIHLQFGANGTSNVLIADYQVVFFENFYDATSFLNSRAFAVGSSPCEG